MQNQKKPVTPSEKELYFFYKLRKYVPKSCLFYSVKLFLNYTGIIFITGKISKAEDDLTTVQSILLNITFFGGKSGFEKFTKIYHYIIYVLFFILISIFSFFLIIKLRFPTFSKLIKIFSVLMTLIGILSQHLIEFNWLGLMNLFLKKQILECNMIQAYIVFFLCVANTCVTVFFAVYFWSMSATLFFQSKNMNKNLIFGTHFAIPLLAPIFQGIYTMQKSLNKEKNLLYISIGTLILLLYQLWIWSKNYNFYYCNYSLIFRNFLMNFCLLSCIIEIIFYYSLKNSLTQSCSLIKLILIFINSWIFTYWNISRIKGRIYNNFKVDVLNDKKVVYANEFMLYMQLLEQYLKKQIEAPELMQLFYKAQAHKIKKNDDAKTKLISFGKISNNIELKPKKVTKNDTETFEISSFLDFVVLMEVELTKSIFYFLNHENIQQVELLIVIHIELLSFFKNQKHFALYMNYQYCHSRVSKQFGFRTKLCLYELRRKIYQDISEMIDNKLSKKKLLDDDKYKIIENEGKFSVIESIYNYTLHVEKILVSLEKCCDIGMKICSFRSNMKSNKDSLYYSNCQNFINLCSKLHKSNTKLRRLENKLSHSENNAEVDFLLEKYCNIVFGDSYKKRKTLILPHKNVLLVLLNEKDEFIIKYVSKDFYTELNYSLSDLKHQSINVLLPNDLVKFHSIMMKKFALFSNTSFSKVTFVIDKEKLLRKVKFTANSIVTINSGVGIIFDIELVKEEQQKEKILEYQLLLDKNFKIICANKTFSSEFFFTLQMISTLKLNFCSFFSITHDKLLNEYITPISVGKDQEIYSIFHQPNQNSLLKFRNNVGKVEFSTKAKYSQFPIIKQNILKNIELFNKIINESGFDIEWYTRIKCFQDRLLLANCSDYFYTKSTYHPIALFPYYVIIMTEKINQLSHDKSMNLFQEIIRSNSEITVKKDLIKIKNLFDARTSKGSFFSSSKLQKPLQFNIPSFNLNNSISTVSENNIDNKDLSQVSRLASNNQMIQNLSTVSLTKVNGNSSIMSNSQNSFGLIFPHHSIKEKYFARKKDSTKEANFHYHHVDITKLFSVSKRKSKALSFFWELLYLCTLLLSFFFFSFNDSRLKLFKGYFDINVYSVLLKSDIYFSSISLIDFCSDLNDLRITEIEMREKKEALTFRRKKLMDHYSSLFTTINRFSNVAEINSLYTILIQEANFAYLLNDFVALNRTSNLKEEVLLLHYYITYYENDNLKNECRILEIFSKDSEDRANLVPNEEEKIIFYVENNVLKVYKRLLESITMKTNTLLKDYGKTCIHNTIIYNVIIIGISFGLMILFLYHVFNTMKDMKILLVIIYERESAFDKVTELQLSTIKQMIKEFSKENCNKINEMLSHMKLNISPGFTFIEHVEKKLQEIFPEKKKDKKVIKEIAEEKWNIVPTQLKNKHLIPFYLYLSLFLSFSSFICFFAFEAFVVVFSSMIFSDYSFTNLISINFLDRIPKMCEIVIYAKTSISFNDPYFISVMQSEYYEKSYFNYYNYEEDLNGNSYFSIMDNSMMGILYYQFLIHQKNLNRFSTSSHPSYILRNVQKIEEKFNDDKGFCIYGAIDYSERNDYKNTLIPALEDVNYDVSSCKIIGNGMTLNPLNEIVDFSVRKIIWVYCDFIRMDKDKRNITAFAKDDSILDAIQIVIGPLNKVYSGIVHSALIDMDYSYERGIKLGVIFSLVSCVIIICVGIIIHFSKAKWEEEIEALKYIKEIGEKKVIREFDKGHF